jgi:hypothetical protein
MTTKERFTLVTGLFYPAALGAGIAWWTQAFMAWRVNSATHPLPHPPGWALFFGAFFIGYHTRQYVARMVEGESKYHIASFANDLVDCLALILAFMCLGFAVPEYTAIDAFGVYALAALIPIGALITDVTYPKTLWKWPGPPDTWILRLLAALVALAGVKIVGFEERSAFGRLDGVALVPLALLVLMLVVYLFGGRWFRGLRESHNITGSSRRAWVNGVIGGLLFYLVLQRMPSIPPVETKSASEWVKVGALDGLMSGEACASSPDLSRKMSAIIEQLRELHPTVIKVIGSADSKPPRNAIAGAHGNNAGLARDRVNCVVGWLATSGEFPAVEYRPDTRAPGEFVDASATDRGVEIRALVVTPTEPAVYEASKR